MKKLYRHLVKIFLVIFGLLLVACTSSNYAPPVEALSQPPVDEITTHRVEPGETLFALAWRFGTTVDLIAQANNFSDSTPLRVGQLIQLPSRQQTLAAASTPSPMSNSASRSSNTSAPNQPSSSVEIVTQETTSDDRRSQPTRDLNFNNPSWVWPAAPRILSNFSANNRRRQGVDLAGELGDSVIAASDGRVVYAGSAIAGLGRLIIIDHGNGYLSEYAHNNKLVVSEGVMVSRGEKIAEMGSSGTDRVKLHFEIRQRGVPIDPLDLLPSS